jgi:hypothetical protein
MSRKGRWLTWVVPLVFLGLILGVAWWQDPDFWRATDALGQMAVGAADRGDYPEALKKGRKAWSRQPANSR